MSAIIGITLAALCFGLFTLLRPRDRSGACTGGCVGCTTTTSFVVVSS